jgi:S-layer protein
MTASASYSTLVQELYVTYFGRPADFYGLQNFEAALLAANAPTTIAGLEAAYSTNTAVKTLIDSFGTSAESTALYGSGSTESFVTAIFENLLNRAPAVAGLAFWVNAINSGAVTKGDAALAIAAGAQSNTTEQGQIDATTIANKLAVAAQFTTDLGTSSLDIVAYSGSAAAAAARALIAGVGSGTTPSGYDSTVQDTINTIVNGHINNTYNLTTGQDTIIGGAGNNAFNAVLDNVNGLSAGGQAATLTAFDSITGGTLVNVLNVHDFGLYSTMTLPTAATISGITTLNVASLEGVDTELSTWSTLTNLNVQASSGDDTISVGKGVAVSVVDNAGYVAETGGSSVAITFNPGYGANVQGDASTTSVSFTGNGSGGSGGSDTIYDVNGTNGKANTIAKISLDSIGTEVDSNSSALTSLNVSNSSVYFVNDASSGTRALTVTLNNDQDFYIRDNTATTVVVDTVTKASAYAAMDFAVATSLTFNDAVDLSFTGGFGPLIVPAAPSVFVHPVASLYAPDAKSLTLTGAGAFTADLSGLNADAAVNATGSSGVVTVSLTSAQSFTGGSGQDVVTIGATQTGTVAGGSATNNEIVLDNAPGATEADIAGVSHFSILGVTGSTSGVFDMSKVSGYNAFDVQGSGGDVTFTKAATGSSLSLEGSNSHIVTLQTSDSTGATDSVTVNLGTTTSSGGGDYAQFTVEDSNFVGIATVNLISNTSGSGSSNYLSKLGDSNLVTLKVSGTGNLDVTTAISDVSTSVTIDNSLTAYHTNSLTIAGITDNYLTSLTFGGADGTTLGTVTTAATSLTVTDNDAAAVVINTLADSALTTATFANTVNTKAATFVIGNTLSEAALATLNLNGNVQVHVTGDLVTTGITVAGTTDNANVIIDLSGAATAGNKTDTVALGNGNDTVLLGAGAGITAATPPAPGATEAVTVSWAAIGTGGGTETIGGITVTATGAESNVSVAEAVDAILGGGSWTGVTATTSGAYTLSGLSGSTTVLTAAAAGAVADPQLTATNSNGTAPTDTINTLGTNLSSGTPASTTLSNHSVTLGTGNDSVIDLTSGSTTITIAGSATATDSVTADSAQVVHVTVGNGTDTISATATGASITVVAGTGSNSVTIGAGTSGTISFGAHTGTDSVTLGASGTSLTAIEKIGGLNDNASGGNTTLLSSWVAAADGATGSAVATLGATPGAAHGITWFVFQGNTYILESVVGAAADAGTMVATNTLVELVGTGYTFAHTTGTGGHLALLG